MLLVDAGNSRIKWALVEGERWLRQGVVGQADAAALQQAFAALPPPRRIVASNVAGVGSEQRIRTACKPWPCTVEFIVATAGQCGVRNCYDQSARLGSDRWAALVAAWHRERTACLVVNCGTATTVDALSAQGEFIGGLILPGIAMMRRSVSEGAAIPQSAGGAWREFPRNTADAIHSGAIQATAGAIRQQYALLGENGARCLLSGGAAEEVLPHLDLPVERVDNLVLGGLHIIGQKTGAR